MRILVTGTAGFIGFHLANRLAVDNEVYGLDNVNDYYDVRLKFDRLKEAGFPVNEQVSGVFESSVYPDYKFEKTDLADKERLDRIFGKFNPEIVINLAAQAGVRYSLTHPQAYIDANITGFLNILEACRHHEVRHLLYASSSSVYGLNKKMPFSVSGPVDHPVSLYAASKKSNELMAHTYSHLFNIPSTGLRFFTVYGPWGRPDMALFLFTRKILRGAAIRVFNHGKMERDFTYVDDIVEGIVRMIPDIPGPDPAWDPANPDPATSSAPFRVYNIGNNQPVKLLDFIHAIEEKTGKSAIMNMEDIQPGDVEKTWADTSKLVENYQYKPATPIREGIGRFVDWYREYYNA
jgi:UDP-glucuronate 4-epimerase